MTRSPTLISRPPPPAKFVSMPVPPASSRRGDDGPPRSDGKWRDADDMRMAAEQDGPEHDAADHRNEKLARHEPVAVLRDGDEGQDGRDARDRREAHGIAVRDFPVERGNAHQ